MTNKPTDILDLALICMGLADNEALFNLEDLHVPRSMFDGARVLHSDLFGLIKEDDEQDIFTDVRYSDLSRPLDEKFLTTSSPIGTPPEHLQKEFTLQRQRRVTPKEVRGAVKLVLPNMVEWTVAYVFPEKGKMETQRSYWGETKPFHWVRIDTFPFNDLAWYEDRGDFPGFNHAEVNMNLAHGFAFTNRYQWRVYLGTPQFPGLTIPTTPSGAMDIFKLRDVPESGRRAALKHWVSQHLRKRPVSDGNEETSILVREHLRGATTFRWNDLTCKILVPDFDSERNERLRREALMRRKHS